MGNNVIRIEIEEKEWNEYPRSKRKRIEDLLEQQGLSIKQMMQNEDGEDE